MFNLEEIKRKMLVKYPFFGSIIANVSFKETKGINTAATDGKVIIYNQEFMNSLSIEQQVFVLAHEVMHIAFNHIKRGKNKNHDIWNIAADAVVNVVLKEDGFSIREDFVYFEDAINYNVEQYYEKLMKDYKDNQNQDISNTANETHEYWYKPFSKEIQDDLNKSSENNKAQNSSSSSNQKESKESEEKNKEELEKSIEEISNKGEKESFEENRKQKKEALKKLREGLVKQSQAGKETTSDIIGDLDIGEASKYIDWRLLLKEAVNLDVDWSYQNATIEEGVVTAHIEEIMKPETEIILDTSSSVNENLLINFLKECKNIISTSKVKVGCFDTKFYGFKEVRNEKEIEHLEFKGGGGTDFNAAVNAFSKRVENKIIFTDGKDTMPTKAIDAIWVVFGDKKINPKGGRVIYISEEQLNRLKLSKKVFK